MKKEKKTVMGRIKGDIALIILIVLVIAGINFLYDNTIEKNKQIIRKEVEWQNYKDSLVNKEIKYGFFGDSHTLNSLNPYYVNNSYNFGTNAEGYVETYYKIRKIFEKDKVRINTFVLEIDTHTFAKNLRKYKKPVNGNIPYYSGFIPLEDISELNERPVLSLYFETKIKFLGKGDEIVSYIRKDRNITPIYRGWANISDVMIPETNLSVVHKGHELHYSSLPIELDELSIEYFLKIIDYAKENNVEIIFVKYPVSKYYNDAIVEFDMPREEYYEELFEIIDANLEDYEVLDYYSTYFDYPEYFSNNDHLNNRGAREFSVSIEEDLKDLETTNEYNFFEFYKFNFLN